MAKKMKSMFHAVGRHNLLICKGLEKSFSPALGGIVENEEMGWQGKGALLGAEGAKSKENR